MGQVPGQVAADHHVKGSVRKIQRLCVHLHPSNLAGKLAGIFLCLGQHGGRQVDGRHIIAQFPQKDGKEARAGAHLQHAQGFRRAVRELPRDLGMEAVAPLLPLLCGKLQLIDLRVGRGAAGPVALVFR